MNTQHKLLSSCPVSCFADEIAESLDRQIEVLSRLGISYVELRSADGKMYPILRWILQKR